ncbi:MAG: lamin tail domain-containing protein [Lewinellaceae bacterium]|nr:lamin tail domain-containing protein [Lewinellaceae bacterium]
MKFFIRFPLALLLLFLPLSLFSQVRLTEVAPTNTGQITDEDGDRPDWIELQNQGTAPVDLEGWGLSDGRKDSRWLLPPVVLQPDERLLVFASGKNRGASTTPGSIDHWETAVQESDTWQYFIGAVAPPADWAAVNFSAAGWQTGPGGFGYGDGDDATQIPAGTISFYYRRVFSVTDKNKLIAAILSMDYDDGFVAYLNGAEIARSSNIAGTPDNTTLATPEHEAVFYTGATPDVFPLNAATLGALLLPGDNVLAVELHNTAASSSDLTGRSWLHFGIGSADLLYGPTPAWFNPGGGSGSVGNLHTDFKLNFSETLVFFNAAGDIADSLSTDYLEPGHTKMRLNDDGQWCISDTPTPAAHNTGGCLDQYTAAPAFTLPAGFYTGTQTVAITGGGEIRYTDDGSIPTTTSSLYTTPVAVAQTTVLRARRFELYKQPSRVVTSTYFINDPTTLPVVSVSLPPADFSDVYTNHTRKGAVAVEYFDKDKQRQFSGDFAGYVAGNWSVDFPQKSLQFDVDEDFGSAGDIEYPLFAPDKPIQKLHAFRIRNEDDDFTNARMRDRIVNELAAPTHAGRASYRNVVGFINGQYWGHFVARERIDDYFCRDNYGANPDSVNMVKTHYGLDPYVAEYGTIDDFYAVSDFIANNDMALAANFQKAQQLFDLENFADYFITEVFVASTDWLPEYFNNIRLFKPEKNAPWRFILWDVSYSSGTGSGCTGCDVLADALNDPFDSRYGKMFRSLLGNPEFHRHFINRFADLMNTAFLPARAHALIDANAAELGPEIDRHNDRWGTGDFNHWSFQVQVLRNFYTQRPAFQHQHIRNHFQLPNDVTITLQVNPPGAGVVKISTVIPTGYPWSGIYFHGNPVTVTAIPNPGYSFANWSANNFIQDLNSAIFTTDVANNTVFQANFTGTAQDIPLIISEINYNSDPTRDAGDWFEIHNAGAGPIDVSDFSVRDEEWFHRFTVPTGTVVPAGERLVFVEKKGKFLAENPAVTNFAGPLGFGLNDSSDEIHLFDRSGDELALAAYRDEKPWPCTPDGFGRSLERGNTSGDPTLPDSWFDGCVGGSPGVAFSPCLETPTVSEVNYKSASTADAGDWLELHNRSAATLELGGWSLRDAENGHVFTIPAGTSLPAGGYRVFFDDAAKFSAQFPAVSNKTGPLGFGLSGDGDLVRLYDPAGRLQLSLCFNDASPWPEAADGGGYTLEIKDLEGSLNDPENWFAGCPGGSPGKAFNPDCVVDTDAPVVHAGAIRLWPNPARDAVFVRYHHNGEARIRLFDVLGKIVLEETMPGTEANLSLANLPAGIYRVEIRSGNNTSLSQLAVVR